MTVELRLGVSVLTHNAGASIDEVIDGLEHQTTQPLSKLVVDNGSADDTVDRCRERGITVHRHSNLGVGAGHSAGIRELFSDGRIEYVLLLEHDSVLASTCIQNLVAAIELLESEELRIGVIACQVLHPVENKRRLELVETTEVRVALHPARRVTFNGLLISWDAFAQVGGPRSDFFVGQEDADLFRRLRRAGVPVHVARNAVVSHSGKGRHRRGESLPSTRATYSSRNSTYRDMHLDAHPIRGSLRLCTAMLRTLLRRGRADEASVFGAVRAGFVGELGPFDTKVSRP